MSIKLNNYLKKIEQGKAINLEQFIRYLPYSDPHEWRKVYRAQRVGGGHQLFIDNMEQHQALYTPEANGRAEASHNGRSHDFSCSFSHLLVINTESSSQIPFVVVSDKDGFKTEGTYLGKQAVIIENTENFYRYREFLESIGHSKLIHGSDIILGAGNQICHQLNIDFLSQYDEIYCSQDIDLGGLTIYQTLKKLIPQCKWLSPIDWHPYINKFQLLPKEDIHLVKAIRLARQLGLEQEAELMNKTRHFLEQEAFLPEQKED